MLLEIFPRLSVVVSITCAERAPEKRFAGSLTRTSTTITIRPPPRRPRSSFIQTDQPVRATAATEFHFPTKPTFRGIGPTLVEPNLAVRIMTRVDVGLGGARVSFLGRTIHPFFPHSESVLDETYKP